MKKYIYMILAFLLTGFATNSVFAQGIEFNHGTWAEIKTLAKAKNKLIFVDFYTDWCGPCKHMTMNIFPQKEVGDFYNQNFIAYKVDAEKGEGPALAKQYHVVAYPTLAYISADGEVIHRLARSINAKELIDHGKLALKPRNEYDPLREKETLTVDADNYLEAKDEDNYILKAKDLVEKFYYNDDFQISNVIGGGLRLVKKEKNILIMKTWAEHALALKDNFINNATLSMLYKQLKNKPMALKYIDKSIEQCKREKNGYDSTAELLKKEIEDAVY